MVVKPKPLNLWLQQNKIGGSRVILKKGGETQPQIKREGFKGEARGFRFPLVFQP